MGIVTRFGCLAVVAVVGACSQPEPTRTVIRGEPMFDKYGDVSGCDGGVYVPGAALEDQCLPPPDQCDDPATASAAGIPCPPSRQEREDRDDPGRSQTGTATGRNP